MFNTLIDNVRLVVEIARPIIKPAVPLVVAGISAATASVAIQKMEEPSSDDAPVASKRDAILKAVRENKVLFAAGLALLAGAATGATVRLVRVALSTEGMDNAMFRAIASLIDHRETGYVFDGPVFRYGYRKIFGNNSPIVNRGLAKG